MTALRRVFLMWQHLVPTSFLKFMLFTSFAHLRIYNFSLVHKSHILSPGLNFLHSFIISHFRLGVGPQFLFHVNCDNAVLFRLVSVLKECLCWLIKLSYSCTPNVEALMAGQNKKILKNNESSKNEKSILRSNVLLIEIMNSNMRILCQNALLNDTSIHSPE